MPRLIFINRYYRPDISATSQMLTDLAEYLAGAGHQVEIVCCRQLYNTPESDLPRAEFLNGVHVSRVSTTRYGRRGLLGRSIDYLSFHVSAFLHLMRHLTNQDIVVAKTDPPLISVVALLATKLKGAILVNWIQDVFPDVAFALDVRAPWIVRKMLLAGRNMSLRNAQLNIVIGKHMAAHLSKVKQSGMIVEIGNWSPGGTIQPISRTVNALRQEWNLDNKFVVGYSGNFGRAHEIDTLIGAAELLKDNPEIAFLIIGNGAQHAALKHKITVLGLHNVQIQPYQPTEALSQSIGAADVHIVSLQPTLEGLVVPSKFYSCIAGGRPVIFIGDQQGEIANLIREYRCGYVVSSTNAADLANKILSLTSNSSLISEFGAAALHASRTLLSRERRLKQWSDAIDIALSRKKAL